MLKNNKNKTKILFISHAADYSGAPLYLLNFLTKFKNDKNFEIDILLLKNKGELINNFKNISKVYFLYNGTLIKYFLKKLFNIISRNKYIIISKNTLKKRKYSIIFANSVPSIIAVSDIFTKNENTKIIGHIHELDTVIKSYGHKKFIEASNLLSLIIADSKIIKDLLIKEYKINIQIDVIYPFNIESELKQIKNNIRKEYNIPENSVIVCGCGNIEWRKGTDFFVQIANKVLQKDKQFFFIWIGGNSISINQIKYDLEKYGILKYFLFTGFIKDYQHFFDSSSFFLLTSREEPFSLTTLYNYLIGNKIVYFEGTNGMSELMDKTNSFSIQYGDIDKFAIKIIDLKNVKKNLPENIDKIKSITNFDYVYQRISDKIYEFLK